MDTALAAPHPQNVENRSHATSGWLALLVTLGLFAAAVYLMVLAKDENIGLSLAGVGVFIAAVVTCLGFFTLQPNEAAVLILFGAYKGTVRDSGFFHTNPFNKKLRISLRARNFNSEKLKVNDKRGNPIEIAAAIVWRVNDTARAILDIDDYERYVPVQAEAALRHLANEYSYDHVDEADETLTLRAGGDEIIGKLKRELQDRFAKAGLLVEDARLTHLAYAPEIAGAMLRRQQAEAIIGARKQIVLGAVSMVEMALQGLTERGVVELDTERRAAMVSNLLVVLCAETEVQPVINSGTLYG
jgi:regulator of protease activity HflC (stomatin/prohibitin superfamily)